jgi:flagellar biosynthesis protein FlhA
MDFRVMAGPVMILMIIAMMVLPLPTFMLDMLFTFNIVLSLTVLLVALFTKKPLEFAAFPSILLFTTLLRLSLNVASTRIVLMHGHEGTDAAGKVIESFGHFLVGGNFAVGVVVFMILVVINLMVITKGAGRIAEVGARFMLDSLPGKQMAIDADLNAGLIGEADARKRRKEVTQETEFYGSMDGASKFVRGDAMAGIVIMFITVIGGLLIGMLQHDYAFGDAVETYVILTIGDGLVAQIPALVISIAAGVVVSRVDTNEDVGEQILSQLFVNPNVMFMVAGVIGLLGLIPGMPNLVFLLFAASIAALGFYIRHSNDNKLLEGAADLAPSTATQEAPEATWDDVKQVERLSIEVGHRLIPLVDERQDGPLLTRIKSVRRKFAQEIGFLPCSVHIRDNMQLDANAYVVKLKGVEIGRGELHLNRWLAINNGKVSGELKGIETTDPAFGLPAVWINQDQRELAQVYGFTVVDVSTVAATHFDHLLFRNASDLLGRKEVQQLLDKMAEEHKGLVDDVVPKLVTLSSLQLILQSLLEEEVSIRDLHTILEFLAEHGAQQTEWPQLAEIVRVGLGRSITQHWFGAAKELNVIGLDVSLEQVLVQAISSGGQMEPNMANNLMNETAKAIVAQENNGYPPVLVVSQPLRALLSRYLRRRLRHMAVMSLSEIPDDRSIRQSSIIGGVSP